MSYFIVKFHKETEGSRGNLKCPLTKYLRFEDKKMLNCDCQKLREEMGLARFCKSGMPCPVRERLFPRWYNESGE